MIHQPQNKRYCLNMVDASPMKRGCAEIIGEIRPVYQIKVSLHVPKTVKRAFLGVTGETLPVFTENGRQCIIVPKLECHASVIFEYEA